MSSLQGQPGWPQRSIALSVLALILCALMIGLILVGDLQRPILHVAYLQLHAFMELFAIVVAMMIFAVGWHQPKRSLKNVILTSAFFAAAWLDAGHMLSIPDMAYFITPNAVTNTLQFWLSARLVTAMALLAFAVLSLCGVDRKGNRYLGLALSATLVFTIYWVIIFYPDSLPNTYVWWQRQTAFTFWTECLIIAMYLLAALALLPVAFYSGQPRKSYLVMATFILALAEIIVIVHDQENDLFNLIGHCYKVIAYLFLYRAIFVESIQDPYTRLQQSEQSLAASENKFRGLVEFAPDAVLLLDKVGKIVTMNQMAEAMFETSRADAIGKDGLGLVPLWESHVETTEVMCQRASGTWFPADVNRGEIHAIEGLSTMVVVRDISERKRLEQTFVDQLTHDALTGLPNRTLIISRLQHALAVAKMAQEGVVVHFLNVDFFKKVNDTFGHSCGDDILRQCVNRLTTILAPGDTLARYGGDEFIIVQSKVVNSEQAIILAKQLLAAMRLPFCIRDQDIFLSASIGLVQYPEDEQTGEGLLQKANVAMSSAKRAGKDTYSFYTPDMDEFLRERLQLEGYLHNAVTNQELLLHYQPKVSFSTGEIVGVEALVRWQHPVLGLVSPARFIPVAEASGLISAIGMWVLHEACTQVREWQQQGLSSLRVSVNLSARQFQQADLSGQIRQVLDDTRLNPTLLELELTESTVMRDTVAAVATLCSLKKLGVCLSIDDFGTGYSSLSYLKQFPIDVLKIDRSFVKDVITDPNDAAISRAIVALAHGMGLAVVAEGVETLEQAQFLQTNGCDHMQGFYFSRPLPPDEFARLYLSN